MFTIITPVFNGENHIKNAIKSVLNQSYRDFQYIIINDGSTDSTGNILDEYTNEPRIKVFTTKNSGPSAARNIGIKESSKKYILFLDADDTLEPNLLNDLSMLSIGVSEQLFFGMRSITKNGKESIRNYFHEDKANRKDLLGELILNEYINSPTARLFNTDIVKANNILFDESLIIGEDLLFNLEYQIHIDTYIFSKIGYYNHFTEVGGSLTNSKSLTKWQSLSLLHKKITEELRIDCRLEVEKEIRFIRFKNEVYGLRLVFSQDDFNPNTFNNIISSILEKDIYLPDLKWKAVYFILSTKSKILISLLFRLF